VDREYPLVAAWRETFRGFEEVSPEQRDFFAEPADAMVSPANSFGIMDGGLDAAIRERIPGVDVRVRAMIEEKHHGEIVPGVAEVIETGDVDWPHLVVAPTMRVPDDVSRTVNAYLAFRAILLAVKRHNEANANDPIKTLLCPGLCTGVGAMPARRSAAQMRIAYRQIKEAPSLPAFEAIYEVHRTMRTVT
jgi:O-acetyl-ADP-ribose deacetylase (regulator of RNase III)